jgi:hypothetical protein
MQKNWQLHIKNVQQRNRQRVAPAEFMAVLLLATVRGRLSVSQGAEPKRRAVGLGKAGAERARTRVLGMVR